MRYSININQYALTKMNSKLRFEEAVLLDYIFWLCTSPSKEVAEMRKEIDGNIYTWFDYNHYIQETPMAKGRTKATLTPRIKLLEEEQWIETRLVQTGNGERKYIKILEKCDTLFRNLNDPVEKTKRTPFRKLNIDNNTTKNNSTIDNNTSNSKELQEQIVSLINYWNPFNPLYKTWYDNPPQRRACKFLLTDQDIDQKQLAYIVKNLKSLSTKYHYTSISTPCELMNNWSKIVSKIEGDTNNKKESKGGGCLIIS